MLQKIQKNALLFFLFFLFLLTLSLFVIDYQHSHRKMIFAMLDVGQGDAFFIQSPTGTQILVDVGPSKKIISQLPKVMSPFDRSLNAIIITNPDQDHMAGILDILKIYKVATVFESGTSNESKTYAEIQKQIKDKKIPDYLLKKGMRFDLGGGVFLDILFPDRDVSNWERNNGSVVARLVYGNNSIMLTGDATIKTEKIILSGNSINSLKSTILKIGHHGSRTSTSREFLTAVSPEYAFISNGKNNKYGHPHPETLSILNEFGVKILRTDEIGTVIMKCDRISECKIKKLKN